MPKHNLSIIAPVAEKISFEHNIHGQTRQDNYYWMRDDSRSDEKVIQHLNIENKYCDDMLAPQQKIQGEILQELKARIVEDDNTLPVKDGDFWYHSEINGSQEFSSYYRATTADGANKLLLLDVNVCAEPHEYYDIGDLSISPNDKYLGYSEDIDGRRIFTILFKDIANDTLLNDRLEDTEGQVVWSNDNKTVFYVRKDPETLLGTQVYRHRLGTAQDDDELVYEEEDHQFYLSLDKSRDESLIMICLEATESSQTLVLDANNANGEFGDLFDYQENHECQIDKLGQLFYIVSNLDAVNFKIMTATVATISDPQQWQTLVAHRDDVLIEGIDLFKDFVVVTERFLGQVRFVVHHNDGSTNTLEFDDPCYFAALGDNPEPDSHQIRIFYSSLTTPNTIFECDIKTQQRKALKQQQVLGGFLSDNYRSQRIFIDARDGQKIPVSLVYHKEKFKQDGSNPLVQYGYGAYGITIDPSFCANTVSLLDRGFVYAIAHIRGGEMLGRQWYNQGKKLAKMNSFNDFIDVTNGLVNQSYCAENKVFASGGSAGGLLMATIVNQAPHLYLGVGAHVPFVDIVTTMLDESIPLTTNEYDEWGNPNDKTYYDYMMTYSPIDNITAQDYPNLLVTTGLHDSQVQYFEPMKWVAKLREYKTNDNMLVFKTDMEAGHGGASGRYKSLEEKALEMAFFIQLLD